MNNTQRANSSWRIWAEQHWWLLVIAVLLYLGGIVAPHLPIWKENFSWISELSKKIGETIIVGGLITFFSSYRQIIKGYRDELNEMLYGKEYLENRQDISDVWDRVSKAILKGRFIPIQDKILKTIKATYFPKDYNCYYHNYKTTIIINWDKANSDYINVVENIEFDLIAGSKQKFPFNQKYSVKTEGEDDKYSSVEMSILISNDQKLIQNPIKEIGVYEESAHGLVIDKNITLEGYSSYHIQKTVKRHYSIVYDNYLCFRATYITNNMDIYVSHPSDMGLSFVEKGTQDDFSINIIHNECCIFKYNGLILPRQGYVILLSHKK